MSRMTGRMERYWERPWGWVVPFGAAWKLGRRDGATERRRSPWEVLLVFDAWSVRVYERGRQRTIAERAGAD